MTPLPRRALVGAVLVLLAAPASARGQEAGAAARVVGRVTDAVSDAAIASARVVLRGRQGNIVASALTDAEGRYELAGIPGGAYAVEASRIGYARGSEPSLLLVPGGREEVDLALAAVALQSDAILVTSTRRVERVADSDVSVAVVDGRRIEERNEPTLFGALKSVKGLDFFGASLGQQQVNARGFVNPFASNLLFLIDHRLATLPGLNSILPGLVTVPRNDIAQVEVVTGPSSALYGANAGNGVVNVITRDPRESSAEEVRIGGGERGMFHFAGRTSRALGERFAYKLAVDYQRVRDFGRTNTFAGTGGFTIQDDPDFDVANRSVGGALHFYPTSGTRLAYAGGFTRADYVNLTVVSRLQVDDFDAWYQQLRGNFDSALGGSLFLQAYYTKNDAGKSYYLDILARSQIPPENGGPGLTPAEARTRATFVDRSDRFDLEAQHSARLGAGHVLTSGIQWRRTRPNSEGTYLTDGPQGDPIRIDEAGGYVGYENGMLPDVRVSLVGRFDHHGDVGSRFSPKAAISVAPGRSHTVRLTYNRAFNSPVTFLLYARSQVGRDANGFPIFVRGNRDGFRFVNAAGGPAPAPLSPLEPQSVESLELGWRGVVGGRLFLDAAAWRSLYRNYISKEAPISRPQDSIFAIDPRSGRVLRELTRSYLNYGELPVLALDLGAQWIGGRWSASASVSWQDPGTFRRPVAGLDPPSFNAPKRKLKAGVAFREGWGAGSYAELSAYRVEEYLFESSLPYLTGTVEGYGVVDLAAGAPLPWPGPGRMALELTVKNLLDDRHIEIPGGAELGRLAFLTLSVGF